MADLFIGGAGDHSAGHAVLNYCNNFCRSMRPRAQYFTYKPESDIIAAMDQVKSDEPINLIGHSYGGDTAATVAAHYKRPINLLITLDPVSLGRPNYVKVRSNVYQWIDVNAVTSDGFDLGNIVAGIGISWNEDPKDYVTTYIEARCNHEEVTKMINVPFSNKPPPLAFLLANSPTLEL